MASAEDRYVFHVEWFDAQADILRRYLLTYYPRDNTVEMYDTKNKRAFLKRSEYAELSMADLYIGAVLTVLARQLKVIDYADEYTRKLLEARKSRTLALIKPDCYNNIGSVLAAVQAGGFVIARLRMIKMSPEQADEFCNMQAPEALAGGAGQNSQFLQSDVSVAMELVGSDAIEKWRQMVGPVSPGQAQAEAPRCLRAMFGTDDIRNAVHASANGQAAEYEIDFFFGEGRTWPTTALFNNCTLCVIRPHAFGQAGDIVSRILLEGFEISAMRVWHMDKATAEEFVEVYKGVLPEYHEMVSQLITGPALVMEIRQEDAVNSFRKLVGPHDPEVAKHLRPTTIRAKYGIDRVRNALHCTDLPEDGLLEVEYFFNILYTREK